MDDLQRLLYWRGVAPEFYNYRGELTAIPIENRLTILQAMGVDTSSDDAIAKEAFDLDIKPWLNWLPSLGVIEQVAPVLDVTFQPHQMNVETSWVVSRRGEKECEGRIIPSKMEEVGDYNHEGTRYSRRRIPLPSLDMGYYDVDIFQQDLDAYPDARDGVRREVSRIAVVPETSYISEKIEAELDGSTANSRPWGTIIQLYTLRSKRNWGIGDFTDLKYLITEMAKHGADVIGLNPFHCLQADLKTYYSPYSPSDRRFLNPLYIDVAHVIPVIETCFAERAADLRQLSNVDYVAVRALKLDALYAHFLRMDASEKDALAHYIQESDVSLIEFARFESSQHWQPALWRSERKDLSDDRENLVQFYCYLQWLAACQLEACQQHAEKVGMKVGLVRDLAVGASRTGSEVKTNPSLFCDSASIGAPPDPLALTGQNWGVPPLDPAELRRSGFAHYISLLRTNMVSCGALRIDHAMSLMRLWWCPPEGGARTGVYIYYPFKEMLGLLCLESQLHKCMVIAEDLGVVPDEFRSEMHRTRLFSNRVFYFEKWNDVEFKTPSDYEPHALAMLNNHDVPTLVSWWHGTDLHLRSELKMLGEGTTLDDASAMRQAEKRNLINRLREHNVLPEAWQNRTEQDEIDQPLVFAIIRYVATAASKFYLLQLEDLLLMDDPVNVPGTFSEHENWCRKLSCDLEDIFRDRDQCQLLSSLSACRHVSHKSE